MMSNYTVCIIKKDGLSANCKTGSDPTHEVPMSLLAGFSCLPLDDAKSIIHDYEQVKLDLQTCQKK